MLVSYELVCYLIFYILRHFLENALINNINYSLFRTVFVAITETPESTRFSTTTSPI